MKLNEFKKALQNGASMVFKLPNGTRVPSHFHITEVGKIEKNFIDCGGVIRNESLVSFQIWYSVDEDHRLEAQKLLHIIAMSEDKLGLQDNDIEVEYQSDTIGKYSLSYQNGYFELESKTTDCLAKDNCGIPQVTKIQVQSACGPGSGCC